MEASAEGVEKDGGINGGSGRGCRHQRREWKRMQASSEGLEQGADVGEVRGRAYTSQHRLTIR